MAIIPVVDQFQLRELRAGIVPFYFGEWGGVAPIIPYEAVAFYSFDYGILEWVNEQTSALTVRDGVANIPQLDNSVTQYAEGEAPLVVGSSIVLEGTTTNLMPEPTDIDTWFEVAFGSAISPVVTKDYGEVGVTRIQLDLDGGITANDYARVYDNTTAPTIGLDYTNSFRAKLNTGSSAVLGVLTGSQTHVDLNVTVTDEWQDFSATANATSTGPATGFQLRGAFGMADSIDLLVKMDDVNGTEGFQNEQASNPSSFIVGTRVACDETVSTYSELGAFREVPDNTVIPYTLGDFDDGGSWELGVNTTVKWLTNNQTSGISGKYSSLITSGDTGKIYTSNTNGTKLQITFQNTGSVSYEILWKPSGLTEAQAVQQGFEYNPTTPNIISVDHSRGTDTETQVIALRTDAGDIPDFSDGVYIDSPTTSTVICTLSDYNVGAYDNGVSAGTMTFLLGDTVAGKYAGDLTSNWDGAIVTAVATGSKVSVLYSNPNTFVDTLITGSRDDFKYPAELSIDFTNSAYTTKKAVADLRGDAGDDITGYAVGSIWVDAPSDGGVACFLGDFTSGTFTLGVANSGTQMTFSPSSVSGKYSGVVVAGFVGAILTASTGSQVEITNNVSAGTFDISLISGDANDFQYPSTFTIDFSPSAYTTRQQVYDLRFAAGDTNVIWPDAEQWGSTDFTYTYKCIWRGDNGTDTRLFSVGQSGSLIEAYRVNGTNNFFFRVRDDVAAESGIAVALPSLIQYGDSLTLALAYSSVAGLTATANGVTEVNATTVGAITLNPFLRLNGYGHLAQGPNSNIEIFKVTDDS